MCWGIRIRFIWTGRWATLHCTYLISLLVVVVVVAGVVEVAVAVVVLLPLPPPHVPSALSRRYSNSSSSSSSSSNAMLVHMPSLWQSIPVSDVRVWSMAQKDYVYSYS
jgi:hypothetical protein